MKFSKSVQHCKNPDIYRCNLLQLWQFIFRTVKVYSYTTYNLCCFLVSTYINTRICSVLNEHLVSINILTMKELSMAPRQPKQLDIFQNATCIVVWKTRHLHNTTQHNTTRHNTTRIRNHPVAEIKMFKMSLPRASWSEKLGICEKHKSANHCYSKVKLKMFQQSLQHAASSWIRSFCLKTVCKRESQKNTFKLL